MLNTKRSIYFALTTVSFLWGTSFAAAKIGMAELAPLNLVILRFVIASVVFGTLLWLQRESCHIARQDIPRFLILGFLAISSYFYIQFTGLQHTTTIHAALLIATSPIWTLLISTIFGKEQLRLIRAAGIGLAFIGVAAIITKGTWSVIITSDTLIGDGLLLLNSLVWAGFTFYGKSLLTKYRPFVAMAFIHLFGTALLIPLAFVATPASPIPLVSQIGQISYATIGAALYLSLLCSVYAYFIWYRGVECIGAVGTSVFTYLNPLFAMITGLWLLDEHLTPATLFGGILVIAGVYLANRQTADPSSAVAK